MVKDNEDGTKQYKIISDSKVDIRKSLFEILPKEEITIFELKKAETSLEDAFIKLVDKTQEEDKKEEKVKDNKKEVKKKERKQKEKKVDKKGGEK